MFMLALVLTIGGLFGLTQLQARQVEARFPATGKFAEINGVKLHYLEVLPDRSANPLVPMIFLHGASGNARDLYGAFGDAFGRRARMIFVDRPGAGYSGRAGPGDKEPEAQARYIAGLMEHLGIAKAVIVGHSLGGAVAVALALDHPDKVAGLVFISPATHPWPGGAISWYYRLTNVPALGKLFAYLLAVPAGSHRYDTSVREVFAPNAVTSNYAFNSGTRLVLRPKNFIYNAEDVGALYAAVSRMAPRYPAIKAPTVIVTGDSDGTVRADIHSTGLAHDIGGAKLVWLEKTGHMPSYTATRRIVLEIERLNEKIPAGAAVGQQY